MQLRKVLIPVTAAAVVGTVLVAPMAASATNTHHHFVGFAGGSAIKALGSTVVSDLTSQSGVDTTVTPTTNSNTLARAEIPNLLLSSNVTTSATALDIPGGVSLTTHARTAGASLLGGAITVAAVDTTDVATVLDNDAATTAADINTTFVGLHIAGINLPITIPKNFHVTIPGVANIYANFSYTAPGPAGSGTIITFGAGLAISLLKGVGSSPLGTEIYLNPVYGAVSTVSEQLGPLIFGTAYGTRVLAQVGNLLNVQSGPTAQVSQPFAGTNGQDKLNTTATVNLPNIATVGAISNIANGVKSATSLSYSTMTTNLAHVNLLGGLITADALTGIAHAGQTAAGGTETSTATSLVNLVIAGNKIPINVSPNTVITIGNIAKVTIRKEAKNSVAATVKVLEITLTTAGFGLQAGAVIEVGVATAAIQTV